MERQSQTSSSSDFRLSQVDRKHIEEVTFLRQFPKYAHNVGTLLNTVLSCEQSGLRISALSLEEAHNHLCKCEWCQRNYEIATSMKAKAY